MSLNLMYITNKVEVATLAQKCGVDWIFVDLESKGKAERQRGRDTVISCHTYEDVDAIRGVVDKSKLLVRINPIGSWSHGEITEVIRRGADIVMLPFFKTKAEVGAFVEYVGGRAETCLLLETREAAENVDEILSIPGIDYVHIGLNDLHIAYGMRFMFEPLANGMVDRLAKHVSDAGIAFGFGGVARMGALLPPGEAIIAEHYRLGSSQVILSRSFCDTAKGDIKDVEKSLSEGILELRRVESRLSTEPISFFERNRMYVQEEVLKVANALRR